MGGDVDFIHLAEIGESVEVVDSVVKLLPPRTLACVIGIFLKIPQSLLLCLLPRKTCFIRRLQSARDVSLHNVVGSIRCIRSRLVTPCYSLILSEIQPMPVSLRALARADRAAVKALEVVRRAVVGADAGT